MAAPQQAEKRREHFALAKAPDWKYTPKKPNKGVPVPYITISYFNEAVNVANQSNGRTNDYFISTSRVPKSYNGQAGKGNGVLSNAYMDEFEPKEWSNTLKIDQGLAVFDGHMGTINKGNTSAKVYTSSTVAEAVADKACWEQMKTNTAALATTTKDKMFDDPAGCGKDVVSGAWGKITGDVGAAGDMLGSVWGGIKSFFSDPLGSLSSAVDGLKKFGSKAVEAGKQVVSVVDDLRTGKLTMQDLLDFAADMAQDQLCAMAAEIEKMVKEGKGCQAVGILVAEAAETVALSIATAGVGGAATKGAQMLAKMGIGKGDDIASAIRKWKAYKKSKKDGTDGPSKPPTVDAKKDSSTPGKDKHPDACPLCPGVGQPVNPVLGVKVQADAKDLDFDLPALFPMPWQRTYVSSNAFVGWLGQGWTSPISSFIERRKTRYDEMYFFVDEFGREVPFSCVPEGSSDFNRYEQITLSALSNGKLEICSGDGSVRYLFAPLNISQTDQRAQRSKKNKRLVLVGMVDRNEQVIRITYGDHGLPQYIIDSAGRTIGLGFQGLGNETSSRDQTPIRLTRVAELRNAKQGQRTGNNIEIVDLVRYEYDAQGDLTAVRNRLCEIARQFRYVNHILVAHDQPSGVEWRYEYDNNLNPPHPKSRVTMSASSLDERYGFDYQATETVVTDHLGRVERYLVTLDSGKKRRWGGTVHALGGVSIRGLDEWGNLQTLTDPAGRKTEYRYDGKGNPVSITTPGTTALDTAVTKIAYDEKWSLPISITDASGGVTQYEYDTRGNLVSTTDANGAITFYSLNERGLISTITDALGKSKLLDYNVAGRVTRFVDCSGNATHFSYDANDYLQSVTDALGDVTRYEHDILGRLLKVNHPDGSGEAFEYDNLGRLVAYIDPLGAKTQYTLAADGLPLARKNALGHALEYEYDGARRLQSLVNENKARYHFVYDPLDRLIEETGFDGRTTRYAYDASGLPTQKLELGTLSEAQREALRIRDNRGDESLANRPGAQIPSQRTTPTFNDPWGLGADPLDAAAHRLPFGAIHTRYRRDAAGRLAEKLVARAGAQESKAQPETQTAPQGQSQALRTRYTYDVLGRLTDAVNDAGSKVELAYDALGQLIAETSHHRGQPTNLTHAYDALGNRIQTTLPTGETLNHLYYGSGHLHQINIDGHAVCDIERDTLYRETQRTQGGLTSRYGYDSMGRLQAQGAYASAHGGQKTKSGQPAPDTGRWEALGDIDSVRGKANTNTGTNNRAGNGAEITPRIALGKIVLGRRYDYDAAGNLKQITDNRNGATRYAYDVLGRILSAGQKGLAETFAFDPAHNIVDPSVGSTSSGGASVGTKSGANTTQTTEIPAAQNSVISSNISQKTGNAAGSAGYLKNNHLEVFEDKRYQYDTHGNLIEKKIGSHTIIALSWDAEHQLTQSVVTRHANDSKRKTTQRTSYRYDSFGRRVEKKDASGHTHFTWDGNRLLSERRGSKTTTYLYEPDSFAPLAQLEHQQNRLPLPGADGENELWSEATVPTENPLSRNPAKTAAQGDQAAVDAANKLVEQAETSPRQAAANFQAMMLAKMRAIKGAVALAHTQHAAAANDPERTIPLKPVPGEALRRALEADTAGATKREALQGQASAQQALQPKRYRVHYYHNDHLGTPRELSSERGEIKWAATYKAWGNTLKVEWVAEHAQQTQQIPAAQNALETEKISQKNATRYANEADEIHQPLRFQGQYYDNETGLHYNRFRYYDPDCGRFVSQDPIGLAGGFNLFAYAPNPIIWLDPYGLSGVYVFETSNGSAYIGKGPYDRYLASTRQRMAEDKSSSIDRGVHMDTKSPCPSAISEDSYAFMVESLAMAAYRGLPAAKPDLNRIASPGDKKLKNIVALAKCPKVAAMVSKNAATDAATLITKLGAKLPGSGR
jgi:RHS repeat-associated protein